MTDISCDASRTSLLQVYISSENEKILIVKHFPICSEESEKMFQAHIKTSYQEIHRAISEVSNFEIGSHFGTK